jgi:Ni/Fe-hydrogenase b-type cytochrome subunit
MATEFKLPELGEDIESGEILSILVEVGDSVTQNQPVIEIKTNKIVSIEILAPVSGIVKEIHVEESDKVKVGQLLLTIDESGMEKEGKSEAETKAIGQKDREEEVEANREEEKNEEGVIIEKEGEAVEFSPSARIITESEPLRDSNEVSLPKQLINRRHHWIVRLTHWINAFALTIMVTSGLRIFNAYPMFARRGETFCCYPFEGTPIPKWLTFGGWLAGARNWHFAMMWLLVLNGLVYLGFIYLHGEWRDLTPRRGDPRDAWEMLKFYLFVRKKHPRQGKHNTLQKLTYFAMPLIGIVAVLTGISIWKPVQFGFLTNLFGGYVWARYWHFMSMVALVVLSLAHIIMVFAVDPYSLPSMITGRYNEEYSPERRNARPFYNLLPSRESTISEEER